MHSARASGAIAIQRNPRAHEDERIKINVRRLWLCCGRLQESVSGPMSALQATEFEAISTLRAQGTEHATHRCRKLKMGEVDFNPEINKLRSRILAWNLQISKLQGCRISSRHLQRAIVSADLPLGSFEVSLAGVLSAKKANFEACKAAKKNHVSA